MYYITTKAAVLPFALLGEHASRADARQMAKELGGTCRTQAEYDELVALHAAEVPAEVDQATFEEVQETGDLEERLEVALAVADQEEKKAPAVKADVVHESTAERPCKLVWHIADEMVAANPAVRRKDVLAACVARGVAFYTARTQYQQWLGIQKEMAAREAAQAAK
jgi:hypothetical protein